MNKAFLEREGGPLAVEGSNRPNRQIHLPVRSSRTSNGCPYRVKLNIFIGRVCGHGEPCPYRIGFY